MATFSRLSAPADRAFWYYNIIATSDTQIMIIDGGQNYRAVVEAKKQMPNHESMVVLKSETLRKRVLSRQSAAVYISSEYGVPEIPDTSAYVVLSSGDEAPKLQTSNVCFFAGGNVYIMTGRAQYKQAQRAASEHPNAPTTILSVANLAGLTVPKFIAADYEFKADFATLFNILD